MLLAITNFFKEKTYEVYSGPFQLNIVGIRSASTEPNRFDDQIHVFFKNNTHQWIHYVFPATTDPGTYWLENPLNPQGTAILAQGQYRDSYQIGLHRGQYNALVQTKPVIVIRDYDRNAHLDFQNGRGEVGLFGINIHRATESGTTKTVDKYSAGCQVFANKPDFDLFMRLCDVHRKLYGNSFTYTLIDQRAMGRQRMKQLIGVAGGIGIGCTAFFITYKLLK